ncbi:TPA: HNH endonuclease [Shewanella algae]|uniref:HNH endonuclease n=1 Tax=Shewanella algae TaxID=38313 RepID=UPI001C56B9EC|nr:HNH endonuclease signature motif containing protein [Shewanella algae]HDS1199517.1 HNH endonuclease [Shewanella algae]
MLQDFAQYLLRVLEGQLKQGRIEDSIEAWDEAAFAIEGDTTAKRLQWIADRQGQPAFRQKLLEAYEGCCCLSGTAVPEALEAAHIIPFSERRANDICNGLLLRADLHTLFDLGLINICPDTRTVEVAEMLRETDYGKLVGKRLHEPLSPDARPSADALRWRTRHIWNSEGM